MEKSIEKIWKEGFMHSENTPTLKVNNLNDLKSIYFLDKFKRRFNINLFLLILTAIIVLFAFLLGGVPFTGIYMFTLFAALAVIGRVELEKLKKLEKEKSSYEYIKEFDAWLNNMLNRFRLLYKIWIPLLFIGFTLALLNTSIFIPFMGSSILEKIVGDSQVISIGGVPLSLITVLLIIAAALSYFSDYYFKLEIKEMYGDLISKLDNILSELEELR